MDNSAKQINNGRSLRQAAKSHGQIPKEVKASCGHSVELEARPNFRFINELVAKISNKPCKVCRSIKQKELEKELAAAKLLKPPKPKKRRWKKPSRLTRMRLPDGSKFEVQYDAKLLQWSGRLTVRDKIFESKASGLFRLLTELDGLFYKVIAYPKTKEEDKQ